MKQIMHFFGMWEADFNVPQYAGQWVNIVGCWICLQMPE